MGTVKMQKELSDFNEKKAFNIEETEQNNENNEIEKELIEKAQKGDEKAKTEILLRNKGWIINIVKKYKDCGVDKEDLFIAAQEGILKAIEKFDLSRENKFLTYAAWWIRDCIQKEIAYARKNSSLSLDFNLNDSEDGGATFGDMQTDERIVSPDQEAILEEKKEHYVKDFKEALKLVTEKEKEVLRLWYGNGLEFGKTVSEISKELGCTKQKVRDLECSGRKKMEKNGFVFWKV